MYKTFARKMLTPTIRTLITEVKGLFTNYVKRFSQFIDNAHPSYSYALKYFLSSEKINLTWNYSSILVGNNYVKKTVIKDNFLTKISTTESKFFMFKSFGIAYRLFGFSQTRHFKVHFRCSQK